MNILKSLRPESILVGVKASDKWDLMEQMLDGIIDSIPPLYLEGFSREDIWRALREREEGQSTGLGEGFAMPHARLSPFKHLLMSLAILGEEVDFNAIDGKPVRLACMVLTNAREPALTLKIMSKWSTLILDEDWRSRLESVRTPEEAYALLSAQDFGIEEVVYAKDLMAKPRLTVQTDTEIAEVTQRMRHHKVSAVAVMDEEGRLVGEITTDLLFQYGMPDFFKQLQSVSFVKNFNPLEKYFENEAEVKAGDVMSKDYGEIGPKGTLIEVIFLLSVKKYTMVYVTDQGTLVGVIYRLAVLNRAINF